MMLPTVCFFIGMAMMACTIVGYAWGYRTECVSAIICFPQVETYKSRR